jgi:germination protein M
VASLSEGGPDLSRPQAREDWEELSPRILVESPVLGDTVSGDFRVRGTAKVSDRTFRLEMQEPDGSIRTTQKVLASSKTDTRAAFEATGTATYAAKGPAEIVVIEIPPMSPERLVAMRVPVLVE